MKRRTRLFLLSLLSLVVAVSLFWYSSFLRASSVPAELAIKIVSRSKAITKALGGSQIEKRYVTGHIVSGADYGNADLTVHIVGPTATGTLFEWAQNGVAGWHICSLAFVDEAGNSKILVSDENTACERE
jgi:hypothetical protein